MNTISAAGLLPVGLLPDWVGVGNLYDQCQVSEWIFEQDNLIGWTYTYNLTYAIRFKRLIVGCTTNATPLRNIRYASNCHIKCFVGKNDALIGSFNLTYPTIHDLCYLITKKRDLVELRKLHKAHWTALS